jgi:hypothetical protein
MMTGKSIGKLAVFMSAFQGQEDVPAISLSPYISDKTTPNPSLILMKS